VPSFWFLSALSCVKQYFLYTQCQVDVPVITWFI